MVAVQHRLGLLARCVSSRRRLGQAECAQVFALRQRHQIFLDLLRGAELADRLRTERGVRRHNNACCAADLRQLFHADRVGQRIAALAALLLGERDSKKAVFRHLFHRLTREPLFLVHFLRQRFYLFFREITEQLPRHFLLFAQYKVHIRSSCYILLPDHSRSRCKGSL